MSAEKALMIVFLILPFGAALFPSRAERVGVFSGESLATQIGRAHV